MAFTQPTVSHTFLNSDGTFASGTLTFTLLGLMTNGTTSIVPFALTSTLNASGVLSRTLFSNLDAGTVPQTTTWRIDMRVAGASETSVTVAVPPIATETNGSTTINSTTVQLSSLTAANYMVGQSITGTNIPALTTITAVNTSLNQVTLSANATATGTALSLTLGATINLGAMLPSNQQV